MPSVKNYVFSDDEESSEDNTARPGSSNFQSMDCNSIGELLSRVMSERREFIDEEEEDIEEYSSDDDSW